MDLPLVVTAPVYYTSDNCGYCGGNKPDPYSIDWLKDHPEGIIKGKVRSANMGFQAIQMSYWHYDVLMRKGFRRSGIFIYKPDLLRTCCRLYTIRTSRDHLQISKKQRKVVNKFIKEITQTSYKPESKKGTPFELESLIKAEQSVDASVFHTRFEPSNFSQEKFELYKKYQVIVHNDKPEDVTEDGFRNFLCDNPFLDGKHNRKPEDIALESKQLESLNKWVQNYPNIDPNFTKRLGPTHECYYLKGKLIAISVLDFLPSGVSSIYFIWDPDYAHLSLGTLSGLREIIMCKHINAGYYYLGYYAADCEKMKYKRNFGGEIMDCNFQIWFPFEKVDKLLEGGKLSLIASDNVILEGEMFMNIFVLNLSDTVLADENLTNIAEQMYSNKLIYEEADLREKIITELYDLEDYVVDDDDDDDDDKDDDVSGVKKFPNVIPGLIPFTQIFEELKENKYDDLKIGVIDDDDLCYKTFEQLGPIRKRVVVNYIRMFGKDFLNKTLIVV